MGGPVNVRLESPRHPTRKRILHGSMGAVWVFEDGPSVEEDH